MIEERNIMTYLECNFIVKLKYAFQTPTRLYFVMEFVQGGDMFYHIRAAKLFSEPKSKFYICEIILAIQYMHDKNIIYRDLKPENILLNKDGHLKICDFGLSKQFESIDDTAKTLCGSPEYIAPEILNCMDLCIFMLCL